MNESTAPRGPVSEGADHVSDFIKAFFDRVVPPGQIEIRVLSEVVKGAPPLDRQWFAAPAGLLAELPDISRAAAEKSAGVFFGVMPRRYAGVGKNEDAEPGRVLWADLDAKDYAGGLAEARVRLDRFPLAPTARVASGNGLHAYWLTKEPVDPMTASRIVKGIAAILGGDSVHDPARILRVPGTRNMKDPSAPKAVVLEDWQPSRSYNVSDFDAVLPLDGEETDRPPAPGDDRPAAVSEKLPDDVVALFARCPRIHALFEGRGKPAVGEDGRTRDTSSSGYDASLLTALIAKGVTEPCTLATVLYHRPDGAAAARGIRYIRLTVRKALDFARRVASRQSKGTKKTADFAIENVRIFTSVPAAYEFTIAGAVFLVSADELVNPRKFAVRFADALHRVPTLPAGEDWGEFVNVALQRAERVEMPPEATRDGMLREAIERIVADLQVGDELSDLDHNKAILKDGKPVYRLRTVVRLLKEDFGAVTEGEVARLLRVLGFESKTFTFGKESVRAWVATATARAGQ